MKPELYICPQAMGYFSNTDYLSAQGTIAVKLPINGEELKGAIIRFISDKYQFCIEFANNEIIFTRNDSILRGSFPVQPKGKKILSAVILWDVDYLKIVLSYSGINPCSYKTETFPVIVPFELFEWARRENLIEVMKYNSEAGFCMKVNSIFSQINQKIIESGSFNSFYNIEYDRNKIVKKTPKKEVEIQPLIYSIISDSLLMSGIQITPEASSGIGDMDFLLSAYIENIGIKKICVECKLAHSKNIINGLVNQLPAYMEAVHSDYGIYLVFRFNNNGNGIDVETKIRGILIDRIPPILNKIRVFYINLEKPETASKIK